MNKSYTISDPKTLKQLEDFSKWLYDGGYSEETSRTYMNNAAKYIAKGNKVSKDEVEAYYYLKLSDPNINRTQRRKLYVSKAGVMGYVDYLNGEPIVMENGKKKNRLKKNCNKDCFNCIYPDCIFN